MKPGARVLGVAESYEGSTSTLAGAVVRADRVLDGLAFATCSVGGLDATDGILQLIESLDRPDVRAILLGAVAPAWFNVVDLDSLAAGTDRPVIAVTFEESAGLEGAIEEAFDGQACERRLERYRSLPPRRAITVGEDRLFLRSPDLESEEAAELVRALTPSGGRPEPLRVARLAARAGDTLRREGP